MDGGTQEAAGQESRCTMGRPGSDEAQEKFMSTDQIEAYVLSASVIASDCG